MYVELDCSRCFCHFVTQAQASEDDIRDQMASDEPWYPLGDGNTFEDMIFATLMERGTIYCPECGNPVSVSEDSLGRLAMDMLAGF